MRERKRERERERERRGGDRDRERERVQRQARRGARSTFSVVPSKACTSIVSLTKGSEAGI